MSMEILGIIGTTYKFQGMADFQYLAVHSHPDGTQTSLYDKILLRQPEKKEFFDKDVPLFIPPPIFSRLDNPVDYFYRPEVQHREGYTPPTLSSENLIGLSRARRPHNAIFINFEDKEVPMGPLEAAVQNWQRVCNHPNERRAEEEMRKLFETRPVWSRNAVKSNLEIHPEKLKLLLPYVAYYMLTGPWRSLWVKFGYDPRKDPKAKAYQVLDFRIRCGMKHGYTPNDMPVKAKRSTYNYSLPITVNKTVPQPASLQEITQSLEGPSNASGRKPAPLRYKLKESAYVFREGTLPPYRQMFYQLCDLEVESLKKIIYQNDGEEEECNERDGWCVSKTSDQLRDIMSGMIKQIIRSKRPALFPTKAKRSSTSSAAGALDMESGEEEEEEDDEEEFQPSEGSDNEMETEILDYL
ncbi:TF3C5 factor, partial [Amia calva]|nr:TF3C5 factor [Amia calva]